MKNQKANIPTSPLYRQYHEEWEKRQQKINRAIAGFNHANMSNLKWRKVFRILSSIDPVLTRCRWKFVADERIFSTSLPREADLLDTHLADGHFQPEFVYREIEWIEIPAQYEVEENKPMSRPPQVVYQNVADALESLGRSGKFPAELLETGLIICGYS